jgi:hypothetical protein
LYHLISQIHAEQEFLSFMKNSKILGNTKKLDHDVELCRTTSERIIDQATRLLMENQIPFSRDWIRIPFFQREKYRGASQIYVIRTNRNRYGQARRTIDRLQAPFKQRLMLTNY